MVAIDDEVTEVRQSSMSIFLSQHLSVRHVIENWER